ncbi:MAG: FAD-dependent oxidoreductase [Burkholderiaceae bacterium]
MSSKHIVVIGSGMAGFGAAYYLRSEGIRPVVYEQSAFMGGHTASFVDDQGFLFDLGPHISFTKDERIQGILARMVGGEYEALQVKLDNIWQGRRLTHPVQLHLNGLPHELIVEIIADFVRNQGADKGSIRNYEDWLVASYGRRFAELFPMTYGRKYHTTTADNMSIDWLGPRMYQPSLEELLRGALAPWDPEVHYITHFRYPKRGGFVSYLSGFLEMADIRLNKRIVAIDPTARTLRFADGEVTVFDELISSVPLPELVHMIAGVPDDVRMAASRLACTTCMLVNVGVNRADLSDGQITYVYDEDLAFSRLSFPHMLSAQNAPAGCGSIQAEVYFSSKYKPLTMSGEQIVDGVLADLRTAGILRDTDRILSRHASLVDHANVIFDLERADALKAVHGYLDDVRIHYCGRYGDWGYMWTDESFMSGERAAQSALSDSRGPRAIT